MALIIARAFKPLLGGKAVRYRSPAAVSSDIEF